MTMDLFENFSDLFYIFDAIFFLILIYCVIQSTIKGFSLSFISFMKWVVALVVTIFLIPKIQPWVSEYIDSPFINNIGLGIALYVTSLFVLIIFGKAINRSVKWTGFGSIDKTFGFFFGYFKGYVVAVCVFSIINWFYPFNNWSIELSDSMTFNFIKSGSDLLIDEFPNFQEFKDGKESIEKF